VLDLNRYKSPRLKTSQTRSKERIRLILATSLRLFREKGIDQVTTNDIAETAHIPIGSVYRYFKNKEDIILAITDLQTDDVVKLFIDIADNPLLPHLSWSELLIIITDTWAQHTRFNDTFTFLYFLRCNKGLAEKAEIRWQKIHTAYAAILQKRDPRISTADIDSYIQLSWSTVELSVTASKETAYNTIRIIARYLEQQYR